MKIFIDSAKLEEIEEDYNSGILDGVTTNPSLIKKAVEDSFIHNGGCLSHHHAVGYEHLPWLAHDISATGVKAILAIKQGLDSQNIMNPGKLVIESIGSEISDTKYEESEGVEETDEYEMDFEKV